MRLKAALNNDGGEKVAGVREDLESVMEESCGIVRELRWRGLAADK